MPRSWNRWLKRRQKNSLTLPARALLGVEQLEKREVLSVVYWTGDAGTTHWNDAGNWSNVDPLTKNVPSQVLPGPTEAVIIDLPGVTIDHSAAGQDVIGSLKVTAMNVTLNLSAGTLDLSGAGGSGAFQVDQSGDVVHLQGVLKSATVTSGTTIIAEYAGGTLDTVTLDGKLQDSNGPNTTIRGGLVLNGVVVADGFGSFSGLTFDDSNGPQTLSTTGKGQIDFQAGDCSLKVTGKTLTIGTGITINGAPNAGQPFTSIDIITGPIDNFGNIDEDSGGDFEINFNQGPGSLYSWQGPGALVPWTNHGTIEVSNGAMSLGGPWTNNGTITAGSGTSLGLGDAWLAGAQDPNPTGDAWVNNGTVNTGGTTVYLGGNLSHSPTNYDPAALGLGKDTVYIVGSFDNSSRTVTLMPGATSKTGSWTVSGGRIIGGTVDEKAAALVVTGNGFLNGVTLIAPTPGPFINHLFLDLLGRQADPGGMAAWGGMLAQGVARSAVAYGIETSASLEYQKLEINAAYELLLHRAVDPSGLQTGLSILATQGLQAEYAFIAGAPEYLQNRGGGTTDGWLNALYADALNRVADPGGRAAFTQELTSGMISFRQAAGIIFTSQEYDQDLVQGYYQTFLRRSADSGGLAAWVTQLQSGKSPESVIAGILGSQEYFNLTQTA